MKSLIAHRLLVVLSGALFSSFSVGTIIFLHEIIVVLRSSGPKSSLGSIDLRFLLVAFLFFGAVQQVLNRWGPLLSRAAAARAQKAFFRDMRADFSMSSAIRWVTFVESIVLILVAAVLHEWDWYLVAVVVGIGLSAAISQRFSGDSVFRVTKALPGPFRNFQDKILPVGVFLLVVLVAALLLNPLLAWKGDSVFLFLFILHRLVALEARLIFRTARE